MKHLQHLKKDKVLASILKHQQPVELKPEKNLCLFLCYSIIGQQLSTKVAAVIRERFRALYAHRKPSAATILSTPFEQLKSIGLSTSKTTYILNVCEYFIQHQLSDAKLHRMNDHEIISCLTKIKGVGKWTAEMTLMFAMQREDVFSDDDLGIQQQMIKLYSLNFQNKKTHKEQMNAIADRWKPYRSYACRYLWGWKDTAGNNQ